MLPNLPPPPRGKSGWPWTVDAATTGRHAQRLAGRWPSFLIVMPSYNQGEFIEEAIRSVLLQGCERLELVVIDGGSTDASVEIIRKYEAWITFWVSEPDRGQTHALNKGFAGREADICAYLNSDDYYLPGVFSTIAASFLREKWDMFFGRREQLRTSLSEIGRSKWRRGILPFVRPFLIGDSEYHVSQESTFWAGRRASGQAFDETLHMMMDVDWFSRLVRGARVLLTSDQIGHFRVHPESKTSQIGRGRPLGEIARLGRRWKLDAARSREAARILLRFRRLFAWNVLIFWLTGRATFDYRHPECAECATGDQG